jgi:hypothetical protein
MSRIGPSQPQSSGPGAPDVEAVRDEAHTDQSILSFEGKAAFGIDFLRAPDEMTEDDWYTVSDTLLLLVRRCDERRIFVHRGHLRLHDRARGGRQRRWQPHVSVRA